MDRQRLYVSSSEAGLVQATTIYWREYYISGYRTKNVYDITIGEWVWVQEPIYSYVIKSSTTTTTTTVKNLYDFTNTPYLEVTYDDTLYPEPNYDIKINWYDSTSGGALLRSDTIAEDNRIRVWNARTAQVISPAGALSR